MNKKLIVSLAAAICVGASALAISACDNHKHTYDSELSSCGEAGHWYAANCGHDVDGKDFEEHNYGAWVTDREAGETADGQRHRTCEGCGYVDQEVIVHQHTYADVLTPNGAEGHWYAATCSNDVDGKDFEEHNYGQLTKNDEGVYTRTCDDCGYVDVHVHNVSDEWYSHSQKHYQLTDCGDAHRVEQVNDGGHEWKVEKQNATTTESGHYKEYCEVCGYILSEHVIPPLGEGSSISPYTAGEGLNEGEVDENAEKDLNDYPYQCWTYTATAAGIVSLEVSDTTALNISTESFEDAENYNYGEGNAIGLPDYDYDNDNNLISSCEINVTEGTTLYILACCVGGDYSGLGEYSFTLTFTPAA